MYLCIWRCSYLRNYKPFFGAASKVCFAAKHKLLHCSEKCTTAMAFLTTECMFLSSMLKLPLPDIHLSNKWNVRQSVHFREALRESVNRNLVTTCKFYFVWQSGLWNCSLALQRVTLLIHNPRVMLTGEYRDTSQHLKSRRRGFPKSWDSSQRNLATSFHEMQLLSSQLRVFRSNNNIWWSLITHSKNINIPAPLPKIDSWISIQII